MTKKITGTCSLFLGLALAFLFFVQLGQGATLDYPTRPIEVVCTAPPGGILDITIRLVCPKLSEIFGVPVFITNKSGASGALAIESVLKAKPDGYSILSTGYTIVVLPLINPAVSFTYKSVVPIAWVAYAPNIVVVRSDSPFKSLPDLLDFAKKNPKKLTYGSTGASHQSRMSTELIKKSAGVEILHVPFQGGGPLKSAILGGHVDLACDSIAAVYPLVKAGNLRALAVCADQRSSVLPQVPTVLELGYPKASLPVWSGFMTTPGTPQAIIDKWNQAIPKALSDPKVKGQMEDALLTLDFQPQESMAKSLENGNAILSQWVKEGGLTSK